MAIQAIAWVLDHEHTTSGIERLVLLSLANHAGLRDGRWECWPSVETIAREANTTRTRTVQEALAKLEANGVITRSVNAAPDSRIRADRRPSLYVLNLGVTKTDTPLTGDGVTDSAARGDGFRPDGVTETVTQNVIEPSVKPIPPLPPQGGVGSALAIIEAFANENTTGLQAITGGMAMPPEQAMRAMAEGGWLTLDDVPDIPSAIEAWIASQPNGTYLDRKSIDKLGRAAVKNGHSPGQFLAHLCIANVATAKGLEFAKNRAARADMPGMSGMRGPATQGKRGAMAEEGKRRYAERSRERQRESGIIEGEVIE